MLKFLKACRIWSYSGEWYCDYPFNCSKATRRIWSRCYRGTMFDLGLHVECQRGGREGEGTHATGFHPNRGGNSDITWDCSRANKTGRGCFEGRYFLIWFIFFLMLVDDSWYTNWALWRKPRCHDSPERRSEECRNSGEINDCSGHPFQTCSRSTKGNSWKTSQDFWYVSLANRIHVEKIWLFQQRNLNSLGGLIPKDTFQDAVALEELVSHEAAWRQWPLTATDGDCVALIELVMENKVSPIGIY